MRETRNQKTIFEPNGKIITRIIDVILENSTIGRTALSQAANLNYTVLIQYLEWFESRSFIEMIVSDGKILIRLTESGRRFAKILEDIFY